MNKDYTDKVKHASYMTDYELIVEAKTLKQLIEDVKQFTVIRAARLVELQEELQARDINIDEISLDDLKKG